MRQHGSAGRVAPDENAIGIAAPLGNVLVNPVDSLRQVMGAGLPGREFRMPLHADPDHAVLHCPQHDVVVEAALGHIFLLVARSAGHEDQYWPQSIAVIGLEHVEDVAGIGPVGDIATDCDARIGRLRLQRRVQLGARWRVNNPADRRDQRRRR